MNLYIKFKNNLVTDVPKLSDPMAVNKEFMLIYK